MKKKARLLSGIIAGLAFMFVFTINANYTKDTNDNLSSISIEALKIQNAQGEDGGCGNFGNCNTCGYVEVYSGGYNCVASNDEQCCADQIA